MEIIAKRKTTIRGLLELSPSLFFCFILQLSAISSASNAPSQDSLVTPTPGLEIKVALLLPSDHSLLFSSRLLLPAANEAVLRIRQDGLLSPNYHLDLSWRDSQCSEVTSMNEAINFYIYWGAHVLFGPICDYAAAPVARQVTFWQIPMMTVGAIANDFRDRRRQVYPLLTRVGPSNGPSLVDSFQAIFRFFRWHKFKLIFEHEGLDYVVPNYAHLIAEALVYSSWAEVKVEYLDLEKDIKNLGGIREILEQRLGISYGE